MKKVITIVITLALLLSSLPLSCADDARPFVERAADSGRLADVIRLRNDGSEEDVFDEWEDLRVICAVNDLNLVERHGPIYTTFESVYIAEMMEHDEETAKLYYDTYADVPFLFIRFSYTVENRGDKAVTIPSGDEYAWILTNDGETVKSRIGSRIGGTIPGRIEPGESASAYLFFYCYRTIADYLTFFVMFPACPVLDDGARYGPRYGLCFEIIENAEEQAEAAA